MSYFRVNAATTSATVKYPWGQGKRVKIYTKPNTQVFPIYVSLHKLFHFPSRTFYMAYFLEDFPYLMSTQVVLGTIFLTFILFFDQYFTHSISIVCLSSLHTTQHVNYCSFLFYQCLAYYRCSKGLLNKPQEMLFDIF